VVKTIKTAISLEKPLYEKAEIAATEMKISRSKFFSVAIEEYLRQREARELLRSLNEAYADGLTDEDKELLFDMAILHEETWDDEEW
jgi:metal-responsive CopG/Arc/MetJ family transcriptional regulator